MKIITDNLKRTKFVCDKKMCLSRQNGEHIMSLSGFMCQLESTLGSHRARRDRNQQQLIRN